MFIAAIKVFADGSNQGYTGFMEDPYYQYFFPFTDSDLFAQPYSGLPDLNTSNLAAAATMAHQAGFPLAIHQNGDASISNVLQALKLAGLAPGLRDFLIHFTLANDLDIAEANSLGASATFLMEDAYYYGLMMCQQILGPERTRALYPAASAASAGLRFGLHSDSPVTPPYPLFSIWTAKTRRAQQPSWYPNEGRRRCPVRMGESISIAQGIKAYTIDAAWAYGLENELGSVEPGKTADLVILSANPLEMEHHPDGLKKIRVLATVHHGRQFDNPHASETPVWPE
jgi:predicted amidohydrolase YtcJ